jgi:transcriptional regulator with XRE-family HTH domain
LSLSVRSWLMKKREERNEFGRHLGAAVARRRRRSGSKQRALARVIGIHESTLSKLENGKLPIKESQLREICQALDIEVLEVVDEAFASYRKAFSERGKTAGGGPELTSGAEPASGPSSLGQIAARYDSFASSQKELLLALLEYLGPRPG